VARLLQLHMAISMVCFVVTLLLSRPAPCQRLGLSPDGSHTASCTHNLLGELRAIMTVRDFWLVNGYFAIFTALCHSFDAVEGSLLDHAGYNPSISAWSSFSCCVASVLITCLEARFMEHASSYMPALKGSSLAMIVSFLAASLCLKFHLPSWTFVIAIGVMGLTVPAWGCSIELGSEVCFPAREAPVSALLEAFANIAAIGSIIVTQFLIDMGLGVGVLSLLAAAAFVGGLLLYCMIGKLKRTEAEQKRNVVMAKQDRLEHSLDVELESVAECGGEES